MNASESGGDIQCVYYETCSVNFSRRCNAGRKCSTAAARRAIGITQERSSRAERSQQSTQKVAGRVAREVIIFWHKIQKVWSRLP